MRYFDWKEVWDGRVFQIWYRRGGNWTKLVHNDRFQEEYGPYATR